MALVTANQFRLTPDILGSASRGLQFGQQIQQAQLQPQINQLRQQALGGDQAALTQLAGIAPGQAQKVQQFQTGQATSEQETQQRRIKSVVEGALQLQNLPNDVSRLAAAKARRAEIVSKNIPGTNTVDTDEIIQLFESGQADQANALIDSAVQTGTQLGFITAKPVTKLSSLQQKVAAEGLDPNTPEGQARAREITQGTRTDPSLKPSDQQLLNKATEGQLATAGFANRVNSSNKVFERLDKVEGFDPTAISSAILGALPLGNLVTSSEQQEFIQAKRDFITAVLRKESGAAIGQDEFTNEDKKFFPQIGDKPAVLEAKKKGRQRAFDNLRKQSKGVFDVQFESNGTGDLSQAEQAELAELERQFGGQ